MEFEFKTTLLPLAIFVAMVGIGVELQWEQFRALLKKPRVTILGTLVHTLTFPIVALSLVSAAMFFAWPVSKPLMVGILLVAACPSGGFSNILTSIAKGDLALSVALTTLSSLLSFLTVPLFLYGFSLLLPTISGKVEIPLAATLGQLIVLVVLPVIIGMTWRHKQAELVTRLQKKIQSRTQIFAYIVMIMVIYQQWDQINDHILSALPWAILLCIAGISLAYFCARLLKLSPVNAVTIAIEGSIRNLTVAFLIATTVLGRADIAVFPMVYFPAVILVGFGYALYWRGRRQLRNALR